MADTMQIRSVTTLKQGLLPWLGLVIITLGIYGLFWYYRINKEMKEVGREFGDTVLATSSPGMSALAQFIPIANLVSLHGTAKRIQRVQAATGQHADYSVPLHWLLALLTGLWPLYAQHALNSVWERAATAPGGEIATGATSASPITMA